MNLHAKPKTISVSFILTFCLATVLLVFLTPVGSSFAFDLGSTNSKVVTYASNDKSRVKGPEKNLQPDNSQTNSQADDQDEEQRELWVGKIYTSKFKCGFCFSKNGKARGVLFLRTPFGQVDVYHLYGTYKNGLVDARHSSGHHVRGKVVDGQNVKGKIKLGDGRKVSFKGTRVVGVPLAKEDCAPLEGF